MADHARHVCRLRRPVTWSPTPAGWRSRPAQPGWSRLICSSGCWTSVAAACVQAGATVIGHLKCVLHLPAGVLACNLTSVRSGARCAEGAAAPQALQPGEPARLDLVVLVYGLPAAAVAELVRERLSRLLDPLGAAWSVV